MTTPTRGLVVGKFFPPHIGHHHLINIAERRTDHVDIIVCTRPEEQPSATHRAQWLHETHPNAHIHIVQDNICDHPHDQCTLDCSKRWAQKLNNLNLGPWNTVFSSETYGEPFSEALQATHFLVDVHRTKHAISGTAVRTHPHEHWHQLHHNTRTGLTSNRRIVIVGAESTGTTTLTQQLAEHYNAPWSPEYGRTHTVTKLDTPTTPTVETTAEIVWTAEDFRIIAQRQTQLDHETTRSWSTNPKNVPPKSLGPTLFCDTDELATAIWKGRYLNTPPDNQLLSLAAGRSPLAYILTSPVDVPFEQDGLRDGEHLREAMTETFRVVLTNQSAPWIEISGTPTQRLRTATEWLETIVPPTFLGVPT